MNNKPSLPVSVGGVCEPDKISDLFMEHFVVKSPRGPSQTMLDVEASIEMEIQFKCKDVAHTIKHMTRGKSPGHDGLSIEHLQYAGPHLPRVLTMLYNICMSHSFMPSEMMRTIVVPIVKNKTGDLADKNNYRPISLATVISKVFDSMLNNQLNKLFRPHDNQFGFQPGVSTESAVLGLKHAVTYYTKRKTPIYACFLDLSKAFDLVSYDILWRKLEGIKVPLELINIFKYWYGNQVNSVRWAGVLSRPYLLECGVRQGGLTSPTLFNLYVNELLGELSSTRTGCYIDGVCLNNISYADDMVLLSASVCGLRKLLAICEAFVEKHGLTYNVKKSVVMVFEAMGKTQKKVPPIFLNGNALERVYQYKYLGHMLTPDLKDDTDIERERRAVSVRANMLARRFARCSTNVKITLFRAYCTSFYTCNLWVKYSTKSYSALRVQYNNAFRVLMGLPRYCSASGMFAAAQVDCFYATMRKRCGSLVRRLRSSSNSILKLIASRLDCVYVNHCCVVSNGMVQR
ncbi:jg3292 [Pararge aegeria aegeria]|uniref:Jg3292 protein n=1 Tax=Pararge aegeria aegeria TaxID=348720 RepID=A0A8S4RUF2_9NEOP|nr:jg3292 [Pararge aegeria aegeria]